VYQAGGRVAVAANLIVKSHRIYVIYYRITVTTKSKQLRLLLQYGNAASVDTLTPTDNTSSFVGTDNLADTQNNYYIVIGKMLVRIAGLFYTRTDLDDMILLGWN